MQTPSSLKEEFLKKWIKGLQTYDACKREMTITERKNAIKVSADVAMASTKQSSPALWRRSIMAKSASKHAAVEIKKSKRCVMKCICRPRARKRAPSSKVDYKYKQARLTAKRLVKKRTAVLKGLIPGGECMEDDKTLIKETLDYILALRVQVDVMRQLACATTEVSGFGNTTS